ncbi:MAG: helix-turn-helix domain-containing protein, partial [Myxococcales bacterium]
RHVIQLGALLSESKVIRASALHFEGRPAYPLVVADRERLPDPAIDLRGRTLGELEELAIRGAIERHRGNRHAAAQELGIARSTLLRKLDQFGLRE